MKEGRFDECPRSPPQRSAIELVGRPRLKRAAQRDLPISVFIALFRRAQTTSIPGR
jgi:hypothetical protein